MTVTVTILVDNQARPGLLAEHGFAAWIEAAGRRLLFDTGAGTALAPNAHRLGVPLESADTLVLSHGHFDHTGGLPVVVAGAPAVQVYCHPEATVPRYSIRGQRATSIGVPDAARRALAGLPPERMRWTTQPLAIAAGVGVTGPIPRLTDFEDTGGPFFLDADGVSGDPLTDDLALWVRTTRGLVVVAGCSHAGIVNTLHQAQRASGEPHVHAVIGGFHLLHADATRLARTCDALQDLGLELIVPCHCTGDAAVVALVQGCGDRVVPGAAGASYEFEAVSTPAPKGSRAA